MKKIIALVNIYTGVSIEFDGIIKYDPDVWEIREIPIDNIDIKFDIFEN